MESKNRSAPARPENDRTFPTPACKESSCACLQGARPQSHLRRHRTHLARPAPRGDGVSPRCSKISTWTSSKHGRKFCGSWIPISPARNRRAEARKKRRRHRWIKRAKSNAALKGLARDLTEMARKGDLDPVIGRKNEIERVIQILGRRTKNYPSCSVKRAWARRALSRAWAGNRRRQRAGYLARQARRHLGSRAHGRGHENIAAS